VLVAAETGSGKTLAYLLPILHDIKLHDAPSNDRKLFRPLAIIYAPSIELVDQIYRVAKSLSHVAKFTTAKCTHFSTSKHLQSKMETRPIDVLVGTPQSIADLFRNEFLSPSDIRWQVLDEADTLLDDEQFLKQAEYMADMSKRVHTTTGRPYTALVVTATLPKTVARTMDKLFPNTVKLTTPTLHKTLPRLKQFFLDLKKYNGNKELALLDLLKQSTDTTTLVFCNRKTTCDAVYETLKKRGLSVGVYHKEHARQGVALRQDVSILVATDLASRGLDTTHVGHVVLYDFPTTIPDYLHRVGRTARAGASGRATSLIAKKDRRLAERIWRSIKEKTVLS
jgi:superfamily II DNA/RNA helicase